MPITFLPDILFNVFHNGERHLEYQTYMFPMNTLSLRPVYVKSRAFVKLSTI